LSLISVARIESSIGRGIGEARPLVNQVKEAAEVTQGAVRIALNGSDLTTSLARFSLPVVENYVRRLEAGEIAPPIKIDGQMIVDRIHRYIAARILGREPERIPASISPSQVSAQRPISEIKADTVDWGNR
jgi:hypothetical protein